MSEPDYSEGVPVTVLSLKRDGVIDEVLGNGKFRVACGSLKITCLATDLAPASPRRAPPKLTERKVLIKNQPKPPVTLDLHGCTVDEAIRTLDSWLDAVVLSELYHVKVIHGLGTGRVQAAVHHHLQTIKAVRHFKVNEWNPGETDIYL